MVCEFLSRTYGWTPKQIREMSCDDIDAYLEINNLRSKEEMRQLKKNKKR